MKLSFQAWMFRAWTFRSMLFGTTQPPSINVRDRTSTNINVMNYNRPEIRVSLSTVPTR